MPSAIWPLWQDGAGSCKRGVFCNTVKIENNLNFNCIYIVLSTILWYDIPRDFIKNLEYKKG